MTIYAALNELSALLGDRFTRSKSDLDIHGRSESHFAPKPPDAVVYPLNTAEVSKIAQICHACECPLVGWGVGTSLEGHALAVQGGVVVDFSRMDKVIEINTQDMDVRVQPGVTRQALDRELRATGLFFPVDPGANATLGGMAATRASGTTTVRYGTMRDNVMGLEVVLADGRVIKTGTRARKSSAGYDLTGMIVGSEGTLGLITELTLRLHGQPQAVSTAVCAFETIDGAVGAVIETIQTGIPMARIEFVDAATVEAVNAYAKSTFPALPHLWVEFHGTDSAVEEQTAAFQEIARDHGLQAFDRAHKAEDRNRLWKMRHEAYPAVVSSRPGARAIVTDVCVPISRLAEAVAETRADIDASPIPAPLVGHVGDGNFHAALLVDPDSPAEWEAAFALSRAMAERALRLGGTISGEHGIGMGKLSYMDAEHGPAWDVMGDVKRALDPKNILNPGKIVCQN